MIRIYGPQNRPQRRNDGQPETRRAPAAPGKVAEKSLRPGEIRITRIPSLGELQGPGVMSCRDL